MASRALIPLLRRSIVATRMPTKALRGGGGSGPLPPFVRIPGPSEPLVENHDCLFDDACAPELALDFDCQNISTSEAILTWLTGFGTFACIFFAIKYLRDPYSRDPAVSRGESGDIVVPLSHYD